MININLLPKGLRKKREPGYWRLLAVLFPLIVLAVAGTMQFIVNSSVANLERERQTLSDQRALLQPFIDQQRDLVARQQQLNQLIAVARAVSDNDPVWTAKIAGLLETLPAGADGAPVIDFRSLSMQRVMPPRSSPGDYDGRAVDAEFQVSGSVQNTEVLADFVRTLEQSEAYGVKFGSAQSADGEELFTYSLTVGAIAGTNQ